jgi:hypothetical protein
MDEYIRADNDFRQRRDEAYRHSEMTRGFGGRLHPKHVRTIHNSNTNDDRTNHAQSSQHSSQSSGMQQISYRPPAPRGRGGRSSGEGMVIIPGKLFCLFCGEDKGHTTWMCQVTIQKQKEIAEGKARQNQPKQVLHIVSCYSPYIPEYVGNQQPTTSVASASHFPGLSCHHHHHCRLPRLIINSQKGIVRFSNSVTFGRIPKLAQSTALYPSRGISTEGGTTLTPKECFNPMYSYSFFVFTFSSKRTVQEGVAFSLI